MNVIKRFDTQTSIWLGILAVVVCVGAFAAAEVASGTTTRPHRSAVASRTSTHAHKSAAVRDVLHGDGIDRAAFGEEASVAIHRLRLLLGSKPRKRYYPVHACRVDHASKWPGLIAFFRHGRFVGYTYWAAKRRSGKPALSTSKGLEVGDRLSRAQRLYGVAFRMSPEQGGSWSANTSQGRLIGFASGLPIGPRSTVLTIEAGDVGCAAMTPQT